MQFSWPSTRDTLTELSEQHQLLPQPDKQRFSAEDADGRPIVHVQVPMVLPIPDGCRSLQDYLAQLLPPSGLTLVVLLQAGASALGLWQDDELVRHKVFKRYVVRGQGRAQPTHLKTRGKSRYGSRLRLQNAKRLLEETNERLCSWAEEIDGRPDWLFFNAPIRLWPDLFATEPAPPWDQEDYRRIPVDLGVPSFEELGQAFRELHRGRVVWVQPRH